MDIFGYLVTDFRCHKNGKGNDDTSADGEVIRQA